MGGSPRARAWQHLGRKGLPGAKAAPGPRPAAPLLSGPGSPSRRGHRAAGPLAPGPPPGHRALGVLGFPPVPGSRSASGRPGCAPPRPRPPEDRAPRPHARPRRLPHLHARGPGVNPRVQDGDEHPPPVILRVATEEGGGPGLFLGQQAVEGEGLLGGGGGHGRRLEDEEKANCQAARGRQARGHPGGRGPWRGRGAGPAARQSRLARVRRPIRSGTSANGAHSGTLRSAAGAAEEEAEPGRGLGDSGWNLGP